MTKLLWRKLIKNLIPFSWFGGKASHMNWLLPFIDNTEHTCYCEAFGGSAAILLNKKPSKVEIYNDIYSEVVNFFRVLRNNSEELIKLIELTPYSREEYTNSLNKEGTDLERAHKFFVVARQITNGLATQATPGRWASLNNFSRRGISGFVSRWLTAIDNLPEIAMRLKLVQIENLDAFKLIEKYDSIETLHYLDPPYSMQTRTGGWAYKYEFNDEKHHELVKLIRSLKGKVILSGYENLIYNDGLYDWHKHKQKVKSAPSTRLAQKGQKTTSIRQEVIWTNF